MNRRNFLTGLLCATAVPSVIALPKKPVVDRILPPIQKSSYTDKKSAFEILLKRSQSSMCIDRYGESMRIDLDDDDDIHIKMGKQAGYTMERIRLEVLNESK